MKMTGDTQHRVAVDNTDWLKTFAIILVSVDHIGYFFIENADWWNAIGRLAAPPFFFLLGYAKTRGVPHYWIWTGIILTLLDSWNTDWVWVAPNILLSFALIRLARPHVQAFLQRYGWVALALFIAGLIALLPSAANIADYGAEGWLWALFGLSQGMYVDSKPVADTDGMTHSSLAYGYGLTDKRGLMRLLTCLAAATVYVWQEQMEFTFYHVQLSAVIVGICALSLSLCLFQRGPSRVQPVEPVAGALRFIGRHTLEIYVIQLAGFEIIIRLMPDLAA